jgi:DNA (cytosine-5)-methyltransferase 1
LDETSFPQWQFMKGAKAVERVSASGHAYTFSEGAMSFPDPLDRPARTIITSEGGRAASRTRHVVCAQDGRLRRLTPEELEVLNGFPRGFTAMQGISDSKRAFLMGNAVVTGLVARIGMAMLGR